MKTLIYFLCYNSFEFWRISWSLCALARVLLVALCLDGTSGGYAQALPRAVTCQTNRTDKKIKIFSKTS